MGETTMRWLRRLRGAIGMGITWAIGWAAFGLLIGVSSKLFPGPFWDRFFAVFDAPLPALGVPGFIGGVMFSLVLGAAGRRHRFDELSVRRVAVWGALGGLLVGLLPAAMVAVGLATLDASGSGLLALTAMIAVPFTVLGSASAATTLLIARRGSEQLGRYSQITPVAPNDPVVTSRSSNQGSGPPARATPSTAARRNPPP